MAKVTIAHNPDLTKEEAQAIFERHFAGKYKVQAYKKPFRDFSVIRDSHVGVALKLQQKPDRTTFLFNAYAPTWWSAVLLGVLVASFRGRGLVDEVREFIETAPEFQRQPQLAGAEPA